MGYKATYGYQNLDSTSEFELSNKKDSGQTCFLVEDCQGQVEVARKYRACDICNETIGDGLAFIHGSYLYCEICERQHRKNEQIERMKRRSANKIKKL